MSEIESEIERAVDLLGIAGERWLKLPMSQAREVHQAAKSRFLSGDPQVWWLDLCQPAESHSYPKGDGCQFVHLYVPEGDDRCWLVPETEEDEPPVYDVCISEVRRVLGECSFFEYYLIGKRFEWLIIENDHNEVLLAKVSPLGKGG